MDLALIWAAILAFAVLAYVMLDGFDLGIGILFPFLGGREERSLAMNTIAPVWDGNETWLVLGGGGLFAVFPLAYAILLPALYPLIIAMLLGLIFRGVAFEFTVQARKLRGFWEFGFFAGSLIAAFAQGMALGAVVQGIKIADRAYAGGNWDWFTPFSLLTGVAVVIGYALLGATWLIFKTEAGLRERMCQLARPLTWIMLFFVVAISLMTPLLQPEYLSRWLGWPQSLYTVIVPILCTLCIYSIITGIQKQQDAKPFLAAQSLFILCYLGLVISLYPNLIPPALSFTAAAAPDVSLRFLLVGAVVLIPIILLYTAYSYWVFRGKVQLNAGYH